MANDLTINQISTVLNAIHKQLTGVNSISVTDTSSFVTVAQTLLKSGYDPLLGAISQVMSKTIFSIRPYSAKFRGLQRDDIAWGNHVRKLTTADQDYRDDDRLPLTDGSSVDPFVIRKPKTLQTNFYGLETYEDWVTLPRDQLDTAFSGPSEFSRWLSMIMGNISDKHEQDYEGLARMTICNLIGAICDTALQAPERLVHLITEYNAYAGTSLTGETVYAPANFPEFVKWMFGRIKTVSDLMTERSIKFHQNPTVSGDPFYIPRHTPKSEQLCYLHNAVYNNIQTTVLSSIYHDDKLAWPTFEGVNYWQSIASPASISITPSILNADGTISKGDAVTTSTVIGIIMDREAAGYGTTNEWMEPQQNARGGYRNLWYHWDKRYWNDLTENAVVFIMD